MKYVESNKIMYYAVTECIFEADISLLFNNDYCQEYVSGPISTME